LFEELKSDRQARLDLLGELNDVQRKLPRELQLNPEGFETGDEGIVQLLEESRQLLIRRMLKKEGADAD
jgi:hypothetical protein